MLLNSFSGITLDPERPAPNIIAHKTRKLQRRPVAVNLYPAPERRSHPELMTLVFDSLRSRRSEGRRYGLNVSRQIMYRLGKIVVEMRLEPTLDSLHMNMTGQISLGRDHLDVSGIVVAITTPLAKLAETRTNQFGEFQLDYAPGENLSVTFEAVMGRSLRIPLDSSRAGNNEDPKK